MYKKILPILLVCILLLAGCTNSINPAEGNASQVEEEIKLSIFAAASLTEAFTEIKEVFEKNNEQIILEYNFASSGTLQKQIEEGAVADYFVSAGLSQMNALEEKGLVEDRRELLKNKLVLIGGQEIEGKILDLEDLLSDDIKYIAMGTPETTPVGKYTQEALIYYDLWEELEEKIVLTKDVKQALTYVNTGNCDVGFIYSSDALGLENGIILLDVSNEAHEKIIYPAAIISDSLHKEQVNAFVEFLRSEQASNILEKYGFILN